MCVCARVWCKAHLGDSECRAPLSLENVEADATLVIDVRVVHLGHKLDFGRLERVVAGELNVELKDSTTVYTYVQHSNAAKRRGSEHVVEIEFLALQHCTGCAWLYLKGESDGPMIVASQWVRSPLLLGPALHCAGGSFSKSFNSFLRRFIVNVCVYVCDWGRTLFKSVGECIQVDGSRSSMTKRG